MRFINVTDEQYELIHKISKETERTIPEVIQDLMDALRHFAILSMTQDVVLKMAKDIICEGEEDGEEES